MRQSPVDSSSSTRYVPQARTCDQAETCKTYSSPSLLTFRSIAAHADSLKGNNLQASRRLRSPLFPPDAGRLLAISQEEHSIFHQDHPGASRTLTQDGNRPFQLARTCSTAFDGLPEPDQTSTICKTNARTRTRSRRRTLG